MQTINEAENSLEIPFPFIINYAESLEDDQL